jgi:hypothetical protein
MILQEKNFQDFWKKSRKRETDRMQYLCIT